VDHKIELEPEALRLKMAPPELSELRKQLKELIDAGYIRALKDTVRGTGAVPE
jgi:hypothetical protein